MYVWCKFGENKISLDDRAKIAQNGMIKNMKLTFRGKWVIYKIVKGPEACFETYLSKFLKPF